MHRVEPLDCLHFDNQAIVDNQIDLERGTHRLTSILEMDAALAFDGESCEPQLDCQTVLIHRLEKAWPKFPMDGNRAADDTFLQGFQIVRKHDSHADPQAGMKPPDYAE